MIYIPVIIYRELGYTKSKFCLSLFIVICDLVQGEGGRGGGGETDRQTETEKSEKSNVIYTERIRTRKLGWFKQFLSMKTYQQIVV